MPKQIWLNSILQWTPMPSLIGQYIRQVTCSDAGLKRIADCAHCWNCLLQNRLFFMSAPEKCLKGFTLLGNGLFLHILWWFIVHNHTFLIKQTLLKYRVSTISKSIKNITIQSCQNVLHVSSIKRLSWESMEKYIYNPKLSIRNTCIFFKKDFLERVFSIPQML